jgi:hypothetical protein
MLTVRCDSCGEIIEGIWYRPVFEAMTPEGGPVYGYVQPKWKHKSRALCEECCIAFVGGQLHANATTGKL